MTTTPKTPYPEFARDATDLVVGQRIGDGPMTWYTAREWRILQIRSAVDAARASRAEGDRHGAAIDLSRAARHRLALLRGAA